MAGSATCGVAESNARFCLALFARILAMDCGEMADSRLLL